MKKVDLIGERFGKLKALERKTENKRSYYYCECECGNKLWLRVDVLRKATSCGCIRDSKVKKLGAKQMFKKHKENNLINGTNIAIISTDKPKINNTSGHKGISFDKDRNKWVAQIQFKSKHYFLGRYDRKDDAIRVRKEAEEKLFGEFLEWYNRRIKNE